MTTKNKTYALTYKKAYYIVLVLVVLSFIPILFISKYNHMSADDFSYGFLTHQTWQETHSIVQTVKSAGETVVKYYGSWQGTFSSIFLMALQPGIFGEQYYPIGAVFLILIYAVSFYVFGQVMLTRILRGDKYQTGILTLIMLLVCTQWMQAPVQAFYFYNAGVHYIFMFAMLLLALAIQILIVTDTKKKILCVISGMILGFIVGGGNYVTAFLYLLLSVTIFLVNLLCKRKNIGWQIPSFLVFLCSFFISAMAPGNSVRGDEFEDITPLKAIWMSFQYSIEACNVWMTLSIVCVFLLLVPLVWGILKKTDFSFPMPAAVVIYAYCLFAAMYTPTCYALGFPGAGRCRNIYRIVYYMMILFDMIYVLGYVKQKLVVSRAFELIEKTEHYFVRKMWLPFGAVVTGFLLFMVLCDDWNSYMSLSAAQSVFTKEAQLYHVQNLEREENLKTTEEKEVLVKAASVQPKLLYFDDITTDKSDWRNQYMAKWYGKKSVVLVE